MLKRIAAAILVTVWATLVVGGLVAYLVTRSVLLAELDESLVRRASLLPEVSGDVPAAATGLRLEERDRYVVQQGGAGRTVGRSPAQRSDTPRPLVAQRGFGRADGRRVRTLKLIYPADLFGPGRPAAELTVVFSGSSAVMDRVLNRLLLALLAFGAVGGAATAGVAAAAARAALRPLHRTAETIGAIDEARLDRRIDAGALPAELRPVAFTLNTMLAKLERAFAQRKRFLADAAHELRTPVAALVTTAEIALRRPREREELADALRTCLTDARLLRRLVTALLELARGENAAAPPALETIDLAALLGECADVAGGLAAARDVTLVRAFAPAAAGRLVRTEPDRLRAVVMNLLSNAIEHNEPGGRVELGCRIETGTEKGSDDVALSVTDTGRGIPAEHLPCLFQPFYRLDSARPEDGQSMGLGLALVKTHVTALGGDVTVSSESGVGSVFTVRLPAAAVARGTGRATGASEAHPAAGVEAKPVIGPALAEVEK